MDNNSNKKQKREEKFLIVKNVYKFTKPKPQDLSDFKWPEYKSERERIKLNTYKYLDHTIIEAFEDEYKTSINVTDQNIEMTPRDLKIGDIINTRILDVSKRQVTFDTRSTKSCLYSAVDLSKYKTFKDVLGNQITSDVEAEVIDVTKHGVKVDVLKPMIDKYVNHYVNNSWKQKVLGSPITVTVTDLKLTRGGFLGKAILPTVSEFLGEPYYVDAFIPGSQIVLNITSDFEQFEGKSVKAFIVNYMKKPGFGNEMSLVCSVKEYLKFQGECEMIKMFDHWCNDDDSWKEMAQQTLCGVVTGVINSAKKCGVFIEIPDMHITGMLNVASKDLVNYKPGKSINVKVTGFEEETFYNPAANQTQHFEPYKITNNCLEKCTLKPIFTIAE